MYTSHPETNELQNAIFHYLAESHAVNGTNFAFVDLYHLFSTIATTPEPFGYGNNGRSTCLVSEVTVVGGCDDPDKEVFYIRMYFFLF
jgi:phospholipase/lecithinase/hemolysin